MSDCWQLTQSFYTHHGKNTTHHCAHRFSGSGWREVWSTVHLPHWMELLFSPAPAADEVWFHSRSDVGLQISFTTAKFMTSPLASCRIALGPINLIAHVLSQELGCNDPVLKYCKRHPKASYVLCLFYCLCMCSPAALNKESESEIWCEFTMLPSRSRNLLIWIIINKIDHIWLYISILWSCTSLTGNFHVYHRVDDLFVWCRRGNPIFLCNTKHQTEGLGSCFAFHKKSSSCIMKILAHTMTMVLWTAPDRQRS